MNFLPNFRAVALICLWVGGCVLPQISWAAGTAAGTTITNFVTLDYVIGSAPSTTETSNTVSILVDEVIEAVLVWQDGTPVQVVSPGSNDALTFLLTNGGNGQEAFSLTRTNGPLPLPAGNYTPLNGTIGSIFLENGLLAGLQTSGPNADTPYLPGTNDPNLAADAAVFVYVVSDTPALPASALGEVLLNADSKTAGAPGSVPGTALAGLGTNGGFAVVGHSQAQANATGRYLSSNLVMTMSKVVTNVLDPLGGSALMPGAVVTYQITASLSGAGVANNLVITDPVPAETTYVANSIVVNGAAKTDVTGDDNAEFIGLSNTVSVALGNVAPPATTVITFRATVN